MDVIEIPVSCSFEEFEKANAYFLTHSTWNRRLNYYLLIFVFPLAAVFSLLLAAGIVIAEWPKWSGGLSFFVFGVVMLWARLRWRPRVEKVYEQQKNRLNGRMTLHANGVDTYWSGGVGEVKFAWKAFTKRMEMPDCFLLLIEPGGFCRIPKGSLDVEQQAMVRGWMEGVPAA